jgi:hypothetical protein
MATWAGVGSHKRSASERIDIFGLEIWLTFIVHLPPGFCQRRYTLEDFEQEIDSLSPTVDDGGTEIK